MDLTRDSTTPLWSLAVGVLNVHWIEYFCMKSLFFHLDIIIRSSVATLISLGNAIKNRSIDKEVTSSCVQHGWSNR